VSIDLSDYASLSQANTFAAGAEFQQAVQMKNNGSSSYSYNKVFDATSNNTDEFSLVNIPVDPAMVHNVKCEIVAVGHNGASTIRRLTCCVYNSNGGLSQSDEMGDAGLFPINLGKCEFNVSGNFLRVRVQGVDALTTRYHAKVKVMSVANISQ
jgi:hypothetical protein